LSRHNPLPENFHEWRRRAKDLGYQLRLLCPVQPVELRAMTDELEKLSNHLGDDHDLVMLKQFIADACNGKAKEIKALKDLIDLRQRELRCAAEKIGSQFYAEKSAQFCARLKNYWNVWR
jgi:CHAD domain-containing protein